MSKPPITQELVIQSSRSMPSFPKIVTQILATLDDPDGSINVLVRVISRDPLISARVLSVANMAAERGRRDSQVCDIATATSLIGMSRVRHITLISSLSTFAASAPSSSLPSTFWQHSVAVGVCSEELVRYIDSPVPLAVALIAGLLHDIGQLWLYHHNATEAQACWKEASTKAIAVDQLERQHFGIDHCTIGAWLAEHWDLPADVVAAIARHHNPDGALDTKLVPLVHVAEVLSNALNLTGRPENQVSSLSSTACELLGLVLNDDIRPLFGRMEARSSHANAFFAALAP